MADFFRLEGFPTPRIKIQHHRVSRENLWKDYQGSVVSEILQDEQTNKIMIKNQGIEKNLYVTQPYRIILVLILIFQILN